MLLFTVLLAIHQPITADPIVADSVRLRQHVSVLTATSKPRNYANTDILDSIAAYIKAEFIHYGFEHVAEQCYEAKGKTYRNNNYHTIYDTTGKLNFSKIVQVVNGVVLFILQIR
jgi:hypothetical protein